MKSLVQFVYNINRVTLLVLALGFVSFYLVTRPELAETVTPVVEYATRYLPVLLVPVTVAMVVLLFLRYLAKGRNERINLGDVIAGLIAVAGQITVIAMYRAQGSEVLNSSFLVNIPNIEALADKAVPLGILGVAVVQFATFLFYWVADPNRETGRA